MDAGTVPYALSFARCDFIALSELACAHHAFFAVESHRQVPWSLCSSTFASYGITCLHSLWFYPEDMSLVSPSGLRHSGLPPYSRAFGYVTA